MLAMMNIGHGAMTKWGLQHRDIPADIDILDIGSGRRQYQEESIKTAKDGFA